MEAVKGRPWTATRAKKVWEQMRSGTDVKTIAAQQGCTVNNIHKRLRTAGYDPARVHRSETTTDLQLEKIYAMRRRGVEYPDIAAALGMEPGPKTTRTLYMRLVRYCERIEVPYPTMPKPRKPAFKPMKSTDFVPVTVSKIKAALMHRDAEGLQTDVLDLADAVGLTDRDTKLYVAELRRRRVIADGPAPTQEGMERGRAKVDGRPLCTDRALHAIVQAWDRGEPLPSLDTLAEQLRYSRSAMNVALVQLRADGMLRPRGFLYLRDHVT
jgi:hypothetical protein